MNNDDNGDHLPDGWLETTLDNLIISLESGSRPRGGVRGIDSGIPSIGGEHIDDDGGFRFENIKYVPQHFYQRMRRGHIAKGDVLVVKDGATTGKVSIVNHNFPFSQAVVNEHVFICRPTPAALPSYLFHFLHSKVGQNRILENFQGSAQGGINQSFATGTSVPIAPLEEQRRIVIAVEALLTQVNAIRDRLNRVPTLLKRFRQAILAAACDGRLTADWREECAQIKEDLTDIFDLPSGWAESELGDIGNWVGGGTPSKGNLSYWTDGTVPWVSPKDMKVDYIVGSRDFITEQALIESRLKLLPVGSVLFVVRGMILAHSFPVAVAKVPVTINQDMRAIIPKSNIDPSYLLCFLKYRSGHVVHLTGEATHGTRRLETEHIKGLQVAIPPLPEQYEIVRRVNALFALANQIEANLTRAKQRVDKLTQAILAKAFRGELVPTEAELARREGRTFETAEELLERVKQEANISNGERPSVRKKARMK